MSWSMGFVVVRNCRSSDVLGCIQEDWVFTLLERLTRLTWPQLEAQRFALVSAPLLGPGVSC